MSDTYVRVGAQLKRVNPKSFIVINDNDDEVVVGRSCVHGVDEQEVADCKQGDYVEFRVMSWLAKKENLTEVGSA